MLELVKEIEGLAERELQRANEERPLFVDNHQAFAVILEEYQEAKEEVEEFCKVAMDMWKNVRTDSDCYDHLKVMEHNAKNLAAEAVQLAAMCRKAIESEKARNEK